MSRRPRGRDRLAAREPDVPLCAALRDVPLVSYAEDVSIVRRYWRTILGKQHPPMDAALTVPNLHAVMAAVAARVGYLVAPRSICEEHLADRRAGLLGDPEERPLNTLFLVQHPGAETNHDVLRVRDALLDASRGSWRPSSAASLASDADIPLAAGGRLHLQEDGDLVPSTGVRRSG